jgi:hypothetical protein
MWKFTDDSFKNYLVWCLTMLYQAVISGAGAIIIGAVFDDATQVAILVNAYCCLNILGIGVTVNPANANWW